MNTKQIKAVMQKTIPQKTSLSILRYAKSTNGGLSFTDLDNYVVLKDSSFTSGMIDSTLFYKSLSLMNSCDESQNSEDFPFKPVLKSPDPVTFSVFNRYDFTQFSYFTAKDDSRETLTGIYFCSKDHFIVATDGHLLAMQEDEEVDFDFIMRTQSAEILKALLKISPVNAAMIGKVKNISALYLLLQGDGWNFLCKSIELPYPDVIKVIPKYGKSGISYSPAMRDQLLVAVEKVLPYANAQMAMIVLKGDSVYVRNIETKKFFSVTLGFQILLYEYPVAVNGRFFSSILKLQDEGFFFQSDKLSNKRPLYMKHATQGRNYLEMPLCIVGDKENKDGEEEYFKDTQFVKI